MTLIKLLDTRRITLDLRKYSESPIHHYQFTISQGTMIPGKYTRPSFIPAHIDPTLSLGPSASFSPHAHTRYTSHFNNRNHHISIANHTIVFLDAPALVDEDRKRVGYGYSYEGTGRDGKGGWSAIPGGTVDYVRRFAAGKL